MIARPVLDRDVGQFGIAAILRNRDITLPLVMDLSVLRLLLLTITGWPGYREGEARAAYLIEENRILRGKVGRAAFSVHR